MDTLEYAVRIAAGITAGLLGLGLTVVILTAPLHVRGRSRSWRPVSKRAAALLAFTVSCVCLALFTGAATVSVIALLDRDAELQRRAWGLATMAILPALPGLLIFWWILERIEVLDPDPDRGVEDTFFPARFHEVSESERRTPLHERPGCFPLGWGAFCLVWAGVESLRALASHDSFPRQTHPRLPSHVQPWQGWLLAALLGVFGVWSIMLGVRQLKSGRSEGE